MERAEGVGEIIEGKAAAGKQRGEAYVCLLFAGAWMVAEDWGIPNKLEWEGVAERWYCSVGDEGRLCERRGFGGE